MRLHELKCWPSPFRLTVADEKRFEIRSNEDRNFEIGDFLHLREWNPVTREYTGMSVVVRVDVIVPGLRWGLSGKLVIMETTRVRPIEPKTSLEAVIKAAGHLHL
jgi:hypothetical protein